VKRKNLDVRETSQYAQNASVKDVEHNRSGSNHFNSLCTPAAQPCRQQTDPQRQYRVGGSRYITDTQATNIIEAVRFAKSVGRPLVAHLTIHWACTDIGDDPDGSLFSKFREGFSKWTRRRGFDFTGVWARERMSSGQAEAVHCHLLFYLPPKYRSGSKLLQVEAAINRLIKRHSRDYWTDQVAKLVIHDKPPYPDGKCLIKGGGPNVWKRFNLRKEHRRLQGLICGKRCGTTENIGKAARSVAATERYQSGS
jgi:hypothetical protein